jgi:hypothetical protein
MINVRIALLCALSSFSLYSFSKEIFVLPELPDSVVIDGVLDDAAWKKATKIDVGNVIYPLKNVKSDIETTAYMFEDGEYLYLSFDARDPDAENITDNLRDRDTGHYDDRVGIKIDSFNEKKISYNFFVTAGGSQMDSMDSDASGEIYSWNSFWKSKSKINDNGYVVEMAIPLKSLTFNDGMDIQTWGFELKRVYIDNQEIEISNVIYDFNDSCKLCNFDSLKGFKNAKVGSNLVIAPAIVAKKVSDKSSGAWVDEDEYDAGIDIRWGVTPNILLNATINPDFSAVEADAAQLSVNKTFSIYYNEQRAFFTDNMSYFDSPLNIVYTRNISDPDYGVKLTGSIGQNIMGAFLVSDAENNILTPGNMESDIGTVEGDGYAGAFRTMISSSDDFDIGFTGTLRSADDYHNYVSAFDAKYFLTASDSILVQYLYSDTEYPDLFSENLSGESQLRSKGKISDDSYIVKYGHKDADWNINAGYKDIGEDFRADLGFLPKVDYTEVSFDISRTWTGEINDFNYISNVNIDSAIEHDHDGNILAQKTDVYLTLSLPILSYIQFGLQNKKEAGGRLNENVLSLTNNYTLFDIDGISIYWQLEPGTGVLIWNDLYYGDQVDYNHNRLGDGFDSSIGLEWSITRNLEINVTQSVNKLNVDGSELYTAYLTDLRLKYQFDENSYLKLTMIYNNVNRNLSNYSYEINKSDKDIGTQLLYSYKLNPQTAFFLGYSDYKINNNLRNSWLKTDKTVFAKFSYAWQL